MPEPSTSAALEGRVAIITGAAGGIGRASAAAFAAAGARLLLADKVPDVPQQFGRSFTADLTSSEQARAMVAEAVRLFGRLDVLFNVAGISGRSLGDGPVDECAEAAWDTVMAMNLKSVYLSCRWAIPEMDRSGGGSIINLSSVLGVVGAAPHFATHAYAASKGAILGLTRAMASHYAPRRIRVNCICPGLIDTPMSARARSNAPVLEWVAARQSLTGAPGTPEDVARTALFLASQDSAFITGAAIPVDGGWLAQ